MKKIIIILIICVFLLAYTGCQPSTVEEQPINTIVTTVVETTNTPILAPINNAVFTYEEYEESNDELNFNINMTIPQISGLDNEQAQTTINDILMNHANIRKNEIINYAEADFKSLTAGMTTWPHALDYWVEIKSIEQDYVSLLISNYTFMGGAHGNINSYGFTFRLSDGYLYTFTDLFEEGYDYYDVINQEIYDNDKEFIGESDEFSYVIEEFMGIEDRPKFFIQDGFLTIFYDPYDIAAYAYGHLEFRFSENVLVSLK